MALSKLRVCTWVKIPMQRNQSHVASQVIFIAFKNGCLFNNVLERRSRQHEIDSDNISCRVSITWRSSSALLSLRKTSQEKRGNGGDNGLCWEKNVLRQLKTSTVTGIFFCLCALLLLLPGLTWSFLFRQLSGSLRISREGRRIKENQEWHVKNS